MRNVVVLALLVLVTGCAGSDRAAEKPEAAVHTATMPRGTGSVPYPWAGVDCPTTDPAPISVAEAIETLRENGFRVSEIKESCGLRTISAMLTNATSAFSRAELLEREGFVSCFVAVARRPAVPDVVDGDTAAASAERRLANLRCNLWGADALGFDEEVRRLDRAFEELERAIQS